MIRTLLAIAFFSIPLKSSAVAADWLCTEEASQRDGNLIKACGIGYGKTESIARTEALKKAKEEFRQICDASADCKNHPVVLNPKRTDCKAKNGEFICHRLVAFEIQPAKTNREITNKSSGSSQSKISLGMKKSQVLEAIGKPFKVQEVKMPHIGFWGTRGKQFLYRDKRYCNEDTFQVPECNFDCYASYPSTYVSGGDCVVAFEDDSVIYIYNFRTDFTTDLD